MTNPPPTQPPNDSPERITYGGLRFDWQDWLPYLENSDLPDDKKREFIETLWGIVVSFVDLGFDLNPTQQICGEVIDLKALLEKAVIDSDVNGEAKEGGAA